MRTFGSCIAGLVAVLALAAALPLTWVALNVADEDGYVELSRTALQDERTRQAIVETVVNELRDRTSAHLSDLGLPSSVVDLTLDQLADFVAEPLADEVVGDAWGDAQRQAHRIMFAEDAGNRGFVIDLGPLVTAAAGAVGVEISTPVSLPVERENATWERALERAAATPGQATAASVIAVLAAVLAVAVARRRGLTLILLGAGAVVTCALGYVASRVAVDALERTGSGEHVGDRIAGALVEVAQSSFDTTLLMAAVGAGALLLLGVAVAAGESAVRRRGRSAA